MLTFCFVCFTFPDRKLKMSLAFWSKWRESAYALRWETKTNSVVACAANLGPRCSLWRKGDNWGHEILHLPRCESPHFFTFHLPTWSLCYCLSSTSWGIDFFLEKALESYNEKVVSFLIPRISQIFFLTVFFSRNGSKWLCLMIIPRTQIQFYLFLISSLGMADRQTWITNI